MHGDPHPPPEKPGDPGEIPAKVEPPLEASPPVDPGAYVVIKRTLLDNRYALLALTLLLQITIAVPVLHIAWKPPPPPPKPDESKRFLMVKIKPAEPQPPQPPAESLGGTTALPPQMSAPGMPSNLITTMTNPLHNLVSMPATKIESDTYENALTTLKTTTAGSAGTADLFGVAIDKKESLVAVLDESGSMTSYIEELKKDLADQFADALLIPSCSARGQFDERAPGAKADPQFYDLYEAAKAGIEQQPDTTAVYIMTDFEDGEIPSDTDKFVAMLKEKHIKLFIRSVEKPAYQGLLDYIADGNGQYICEKPEPATNAP